MGHRGARRSQRERGQTAQDFALGIGFFIIAVAFVFAFVPSMLTFTTAAPGAKAASQADRAASGLVSDMGTGNSPNELNGTLLAAHFATNGSAEQLRSELSLSNLSDINVTVRTLDDNRVVLIPNATGAHVTLTAGQEYREGQPAAEVARVVTITNDDDACRPACQLVVRVW